MPIIDVPVHLFPDALAGRTLPKLSHIAAECGAANLVGGGGGALVEGVQGRILLP